MKVFVIIVSFNGMQRNWISRCLSSLQLSTISISILVVDNNSSDNTVEYIKEKFPGVLLVQCSENHGFGKANNIGLQRALKMGGEYFFLLNQDARIEKDTIERLVFAAKQNTEFGIISPIHLNGTGTALDYSFSNYIVPTRCKNLLSDLALNRVKDKVYESRFICAAAWMITRECLRIVGGFNPSFHHYGEDDNYVNRLHYKKMKLGVYPISYIYHDREERNLPVNPNKERVLYRKLMIRVTNPNLIKDTAYYKKRLLFSSMINILLLQFTKSSSSFKEWKMIIDIQQEVKGTLAESISDDDYIFLK